MGRGGSSRGARSRRSSGRGQTPRGVGRRRGAGAEVREDLVDHRRLGADGDETHRAVAGGAREGIDCEDLLQQRRRRAFTQRRLASVGASRGAGTMAGGTAHLLGLILISAFRDERTFGYRKPSLSLLVAKQNNCA